MDTCMIEEAEIERKFASISPCFGKSDFPLPLASHFLQQEKKGGNFISNENFMIQIVFFEIYLQEAKIS